MWGQKYGKAGGLRSLAAVSLTAAVSIPMGCATTHAAPPTVAVSVAPANHVTPVVAAQPVAPVRGVPFTSEEFGFQLDKPAGDAWALATNVTSPEGHQIPVVVAHPESGAQIVVQVSEPVRSPRELAMLLRDKLQAEQAMSLSQPEKLSIDSGGTAYGFNFAVKGEANGRVAIISVGDQIVLVVASWPENADKDVVNQIDGIVKSVRATRTATQKPMLRPDKA